MANLDRHTVRKGRGAGSNPAGRFELTRSEVTDDGWGSLDEPVSAVRARVQADRARSIITRNNSPDVPFDQSINPYQGCEHGCVYCYARPSHAVLNLSPGLDFETRLFYKPNAVELLEKQLSTKRYRCSPIALGANTDPYQPIERKYEVTRGILETLSKCDHPATIVTKGAALILRDIDLLADMARRNLITVHVSVTTLDAKLKRTLEPRAASPAARLSVIRKLADACVPVGVLVAPVIPVLTDHELERILEAAATARAASARYILLRLPYEVKTLFRQWLADHEPLKAEHVMSRIHALRGGRDNDPRFATRYRGEGEYAELLARRFELATRRCGLDGDLPSLDTTRFRPPAAHGPQLSLL
ncbi:MAG: PA0069 family radical SAM protein [Gammaproteobacteria bacterium]|nr:PA0069 family radical SAM protein [Gammaproteobacteria bacterium]